MGYRKSSPRTAAQKTCQETNVPSHDVIILSETWLNDSITTSEIGLQGYVIYRCDKSALTSNFNRGGGVLIAVKRCLQSTIIRANNSHIEHLFVSIRHGTTVLVFATVYIPPVSPMSIYEDHVSSVVKILEEHPDCKFYLLGDYNLPHIDWFEQDSCQHFNTRARVSLNETKAAELITESFNFCNLLQKALSAINTAYSLIYVSRTIARLTSLYHLIRCCRTIITIHPYMPVSIAELFRMYVTTHMCAMTSIMATTRRSANILAQYHGTNYC
ncbi:hypothetical protein KPH14_007663 [Odynerus spinipes]|uniref:Endonuclease/exonuclease/phosphatase domain-containing protein n=1 Tax=Odynerus spinipes TaxID=1348599 RepID=A0AAD9R8S2_9HYME|nr:hypothetical protein KPH14_007663 [Odynerus spinipes]